MNESTERKCPDCVGSMVPIAIIDRSRLNEIASIDTVLSYTSPQTKPGWLGNRASHVRSCAMLVGQKWRVPRSAIIDEVERQSRVKLLEITNDDQIRIAIKILETLRENGLPDGCPGN